jgi:hypothetical protein
VSARYSHMKMAIWAAVAAGLPAVCQAQQTQVPAITRVDATAAAHVSTAVPSNRGGRPIRAKTYARVLHAMLRGALARIGTGSGHGGGGLGRQAGAAAGRLEVAAARDDVRMGKRGDTGEVLIADLVAGVA